MYYILSLVGYEEYHPIWFESTLSKEEFKRAISEVVKPIIKKALENSEPNYIDGYVIVDNFQIGGLDMLKNAMKELGFRAIELEPTSEINFTGACLYNKKDNKPSIFSDEDWQKILEHNEKVREIDRSATWKKLEKEN